MLFRQLRSRNIDLYLWPTKRRDAVLIDSVRAADTELIEQLGLAGANPRRTPTTFGCGLRKCSAAVVVSGRSGVRIRRPPRIQGERVTFGRHALEVHETPGHRRCVSFSCHEQGWRSRVTPC